MSMMLFSSFGDFGHTKTRQTATVWRVAVCFTRKMGAARLTRPQVRLLHALLSDGIDSIVSPAW
jgi:hypothetical protein